MEINFIYKEVKQTIQCKPYDKIEDVIKMLSQKIEIDLNSKMFLYNNKILENNTIIEKVMTDDDRKRKNMTILIFEYIEEEEKKSNPISFNPKKIICQKCGDNARINIKKNKMIYQCKNSHFLGDLILYEKRKIRKIDRLKRDYKKSLNKI